MTTKREYLCNLCREPIRATPEDTKHRPGVGIRYESRDSITPKAVHDAENHICMPCIQAIKGLSCS
jgi:hypothetical protein